MNTDSQSQEQVFVDTLDEIVELLDRMLRPTTQAGIIVALLDETEIHEVTPADGPVEQAWKNLVSHIGLVEAIKAIRAVGR